MCFNDCSTKYARSLILLIKSIIDYWTGNMKKQVKIAAKSWMPVIEDVISLDVIPPGMEIVMFCPGVSGSDE